MGDIVPRISQIGRADERTLPAAVGALPGFAFKAQAPVVFHPCAIAVDGRLHLGRNGRIFPDTGKHFSDQAGVFVLQAGETIFGSFRARELC